MSEKMILTAGDFSSYAKLSNFESTKEMDLAIRSFLYNFKHEMSKTEETIIKLISQLAFKLKGVFAIKHEKLAVYAGVSPKTVQRALKKFSDWNLLDVYETRTTVKQKTAKGKGNPKGRGHNVYVIKPVDHIDFEALEQKKALKQADEKQNVQSNVQSVVSSRSIAVNLDAPTVEEVKNEADTKSFYSKPSKESLKKKTLVQRAVAQLDQLDESLLVPHWIPKNFASVALKIFDVADDVKKAYTTARKAIYATFKPLTNFDSFTLQDKEIEEFADKVIRAYFQKLKERQSNTYLKPIEDHMSYIAGIAKNIANQHIEQMYENDIKERDYNIETVEVSSPRGNWLTDEFWEEVENEKNRNRLAEIENKLRESYMANNIPYPLANRSF